MVAGTCVQTRNFGGAAESGCSIALHVTGKRKGVGDSELELKESMEVTD